MSIGFAARLVLTEERVFLPGIGAEVGLKNGLKSFEAILENLFGLFLNIQLRFETCAVFRQSNWWSSCMRNE